MKSYRYEPTVWTKITGTETAAIAIGSMELNEYMGCTYHNYNHVRAAYQYLHDTNQPYDVLLDWALMFHDVIYDQYPDKELRSGEFFNRAAKVTNLTLADSELVPYLIGCTVTHEVLKDVPAISALIRADLHGLADRETTVKNYKLLQQEAHNLYGLPIKEIARNTAVFMGGLKSRIITNKITDPKYVGFYDKVIDGIDLTIYMAEKDET